MDSSRKNNSNSLDFGCPHLGHWEDSQTASTFANRAHYCFRVSSPQKPSLDYQGDYCITGKYRQCVVFRCGDDLKAITDVFGSVNLGERIRLRLKSWQSQGCENDV